MNTIEQFLIDCLKRNGCVHTETVLDHSSLHQLVILARHLGVSPLVYARNKSQQWFSHIPEEIRKALKNDYIVSSVRNRKILDEFKVIMTAFTAAGIPVIPLKGICLAACFYDDPALRPMTDIDLVVPKDQIDNAWEVLNKMGYYQKRSLDTDTSMQVVQHLPISVNDSCICPVELHWNITPPNTAYSIEPDRIWRDVQVVDHDDFKVHTLPVEELILHLCMHLAYIHEFSFGLRPYCDIDTVVRKHLDVIDWNRLIQTCNEWQWNNGVYLALRMAKVWFDTPINETTLNALCPAGVGEHILNAVSVQSLDLTDPHHHAVPTASFAQVWHVGNLKDKLLLISRRFIMDKPFIAKLYGISPTSKRIYWCYLLRWYDLIRRYLPLTHRLIRRNTKSVGLLNSREVLNRWITSSL